MRRYALRLTQEVMEAAANVVGEDAIDVGNHELFLVIDPDPENPRKFAAEFMTIDELVEITKEDDTLEIIA